MTSPETDFVKNIIEAILFISENPVPLEQIHSVLEEVPLPDIRRTILDLKAEYEENSRGMIIMEIAGGYQMLSSPHYTDAIRRFFKKKVKEKLSSPALETLAIIAYKQPVSRADVEQIRGVNSDGVVAHLLSKGLIKVVGRKEIPGRPYIYGTTKQFLEYFGLKSLKDLPKLEDFPSLFTSSGDVKPEFVQDHAAPADGEPLPEPSGEDGSPEPEAPRPEPGPLVSDVSSGASEGLLFPSSDERQGAGLPDGDVSAPYAAEPPGETGISDPAPALSQGPDLADCAETALDENEVMKETVHEPY